MLLRLLGILFCLALMFGGMTGLVCLLHDWATETARRQTGFPTDAPGLTTHEVWRGTEGYRITLAPGLDPRQVILQLTDSQRAGTSPLPCTETLRIIKIPAKD